MSGTYYSHTVYPVFKSSGSSATARAEFEAIQAGFDKLPDLSVANALKILGINSGGTAVEAITSTGTGNAVRATDPTFTLTDTTTNDASTSQHGWMKKFPGGTSTFLRGDGSFAGVGNASMIAVQRSSNTVLAVADTSKIFELTGTFTQTFNAVASLAVGWYVVLINVSTGDITLDPNGAETIDGLASYIMYPGEARLIYVNEAGTALKSIVLKSFNRTFTATENFTKPPGYTYFGAVVWSGGSSGQKTNDVTILSLGGGGGGCFNFLMPTSLFGTTETITIGAGGAAVTGVANGNTGGTSLIGGICSVSPGNNFYNGGSVYPALVISTAFSVVGAVGFEGGVTSGVADNNNSIWGGAASCSFATKVISGSSIFGGGAGGSLSNAAVVAARGTSYFGGNGGAPSSTGNGTAGAAPGGGGGATQTGTSSGAGARGEVRMYGVV
jgi:hypothetical protein